MVHIKICGLTRVEDALDAVSAGADALGINFYPGSPRCVSQELAKAIVDAVAERALTVGVFVDTAAEEIQRLQASVGFRCVQFHGAEPPEQVARFLPHAYKALRVRGPQVIDEARRFPGEHILLDAYVPGQVGGTGATFDWQLAAQIAKERKVTLAGGLNPGNVAEAIAAVRPFCVDVASGVESSPGIKDRNLIIDFVNAVHEVSASRT